MSAMTELWNRAATQKERVPDISARCQFTSWLYSNLDLNYTKGRSIGAAKGEDHVLFAPSLTSIDSLSAKNKDGFSGSLRYRFMDQRPANKLNTGRTNGYFITRYTACLWLEKV